MLLAPDLLAHGEVLRVERKGAAPALDCSGHIALALPGGAERKRDGPIIGPSCFRSGEGLDCLGRPVLTEERISERDEEVRIIWPVGKLPAQDLELERFLRDEVRLLPRGEVGYKEGLDLLADLRTTQVKAADVQEADDPSFIDQEAVWHDVEVEQPSQDVRAVHGGREGKRGRKGSHALWVRIDRDAQEGERGRIRIFLYELLPPGQLTATLSPACPHEDEESLAAIIAESNCGTVEARERDVGK